MYVRAGSCTFINKRTADDIWKNLFEFPLIETIHTLTEGEFYALPEFQNLFAGEEPVIRSVCRNVKHVLSHRVIYANFYEILLPEHTHSFSCYQKILVSELGHYAVPRLIHRFIEKYI
jgi:A/G-specific adenine glycosylase